MARSIVIVDDNPDDVEIFCRALRRSGLDQEVQSFSNAEDAMEHLARLATPPATEERWPLLCVLDVKMPGFHGAEVLQWIRARDVFATMPVMMCSSSDEPGDIRQAAQFGAQCYARKCPTSAELRAIIRCAEAFTGDPSEKFAVSCNLLLPLPPEGAVAYR